MTHRLERAAAALWLGLALALGGCASIGSTAPGTTVAEVQASHGRPSAVYPRPGGGERFEYGGGSFGLQAWMLDFDARSRLEAVTQVRDDRVFDTLRTGMPREELLYRLGHPSYVSHLPRQDHELWSYLYDNPFCLWFQVSVDRKTGTVAGMGRALHPRCVWDRR